MGLLQVSIALDGANEPPEQPSMASTPSPCLQVDLSGLVSREQRMAFFINIYNALVVHALVVFGAAEGTLSR